MSAIPGIKGFLIPHFHSDDHMVNGLLPADFDKVAKGYACGHCLAEFTTYTVKCPVCFTERDVAADIQQAPAMWQDAMGEPGEGEKTVARTAEEAIRELVASPDVEHIPVEKLRNTRKKR